MKMSCVEVPKHIYTQEHKLYYFNYHSEGYWGHLNKMTTKQSERSCKLIHVKWFSFFFKENSSSREAGGKLRISTSDFLRRMKEKFKKTIVKLLNWQFGIIIERLAPQNSHSLCHRPQRFYWRYLRKLLSRESALSYGR